MEVPPIDRAAEAEILRLSEEYTLRQYEIAQYADRRSKDHHWRPFEDEAMTRMRAAADSVRRDRDALIAKLVELEMRKPPQPVFIPKPITGP